MNTVKVIIAMLFFAILSPLDAQYDIRSERKGEKIENNRGRPNFAKKSGNRLKKRHMRSMRKMAAADGKITVREKRLLIRERRRVY